jgi:hypothetical protein
VNGFWNDAWPVVAALLPFLGFLLVCFIIVRALFNADRNERKAQAQWAAEQERARGSADSEPENRRPQE